MCVLKQDRVRGRRKGSVTGSPRASSGGSPRTPGGSPRTPRSRRWHRRSHSHSRTPTDRHDSRRRTHSMDFVNNTQILNKKSANPESPKRVRRMSGGPNGIQATNPVASRKKDVNLKRIFGSINKMEWPKGKHEYLKWRVDYCPRSAKVLEKAGKICIHCSKNNKCCIQDKNNCMQDESVVNFVDKFPPKLRKIIAKKFEHYIKTYSD
eukprot:TRINITY_DN1858_c0_g1_i7.p1 TRINITY_DN1858_c0_g1~~TRINITY_DN1858_c0_g1_i7.p1  ORF type:complete len:208 (+),score=41.57 TRINITY_DN1858_c0_g1_i7:993-1616(+)